MSFKRWSKDDPMIQARKARTAATQAQEEAVEARARADRAARQRFFGRRPSSAAVEQDADDRERYAALMEQRAADAEALAARMAAPTPAPAAKAGSSPVGPPTFDARTVAALRARAAEAFGATLSLSASAAATPSRSAGDIDASWARAREFNSTGGRRCQEPK